MQAARGFISVGPAARGGLSSTTSRSVTEQRSSRGNQSAQVCHKDALHQHRNSNLIWGPKHPRTFMPGLGVRSEWCRRTRPVLRATRLLRVHDYGFGGEYLGAECKSIGSLNSAALRERCRKITVGRNHTFFTNQGRQREENSTENQELLSIQGREPGSRHTSTLHLAVLDPVPLWARGFS